MVIMPGLQQLIGLSNKGKGITPMQVTKSQIAHHLSRGEQAICERAIIALYHEQQVSEMLTGTHAGHDGRGYTEKDTTILNHFAWRLLGVKGSTPQHLTPAQLGVCADLLPKYAAQLLR